jgi:hypothetical protein
VSQLANPQSKCHENHDQMPSIPSAAPSSLE